ncbi:LysE family transporter [Carnimonas nigrificans]|uniref:LysE family transporter n=1 Tax=Carnimonas nigrificans TaxID=64323 RepID=UPI000470167F|nr:LysE family transporter [Carnimonas nigrificans]
MINLLPLMLIHLGVLASPGPDFLFVAQTSVQRGLKQAFVASLGVVVGILVWATLAVTGLSIIVAIRPVHIAISVLGAAYILWLGVQLIAAGRNKTSTGNDELAVEDKKVRIEAGYGKSLFKGLLTNLSNPKAVVYFGSIFSLFIQPEMDAFSRYLIVMIVAFESLLFFLLVSRTFSFASVRRFYERKSATIDLITGIVFVVFAVVIAATLF